MWWGLGADKKHHDASPDVQIKSAKCIVLYTSYRSNMLYELQSLQVKLLLNAQGVEFLSVDGADPDYRDVRNQLWGVSRAARAYTPQQYPQVFVRTDGKLEYVGGAKDVQDMVDRGTFAEVFAHALVAAAAPDAAPSIVEGAAKVLDAATSAVPAFARPLRPPLYRRPYYSLSWRPRGQGATTNRQGRGPSLFGRLA